MVLALLHGGEEIDGTKKDLSEKPEFCLCRGWQRWDPNTTKTRRSRVKLDHNDRTKKLIVKASRKAPLRRSV